MEPLFQNEVLDTRDEEIDIFTHNKTLQKIKPFKWKIIGVGIFLILVCLIIILICKTSDKNENSVKQENPVKNEDPLDISSSSSFKNDPYFKRYSEIFPFALRADSEGKIEIENSGLEEISEDKLSFIKESSYSVKKIEVEQEEKSSYNSDFSVSIDTSVYCDAKFQRKVKESNGKSNKKYLIGGKYNICSLSVKRENIVFSKSFLNKIKDIADDEITNAEKAKELDTIFKDYGYYIPLKIYIGGYFYKDVNSYEDYDKINKLLEIQANLDVPYVKANGNYSSQYEKYILNLFYNENLVVKGGDITKDNFDDWKLTLNYDNAEIMEYSNIIKITNLINDVLDKETKKLLKEPLYLVDYKYIKREKYLKYLEKVKEFGSYGKIEKGEGNRRNGICEKDEDGLIYSDLKDMRKYREIKEVYTDIIVGWKITSFWNDGTNGKYTFYDPIGKKSVSAIFDNRMFRDLHYSLEIFLLKCPE